MNLKTVDIWYVTNKLVITRLLRTTWALFSSVHIVYCYFTPLKVREITRQNRRSQENAINNAYYCVKSVRIRSYSGLYFPIFGLNTGQNNSEYRHTLRSVYYDRII